MSRLVYIDYLNNLIRSTPGVVGDLGDHASIEDIQQKIKDLDDLHTIDGLLEEVNSPVRFFKSKEFLNVNLSRDMWSKVQNLIIMEPEVEDLVNQNLGALLDINFDPSSVSVSAGVFAGSGSLLTELESEVGGNPLFSSGEDEEDEEIIEYEDDIDNDEDEEDFDEEEEIIEYEDDLDNGENEDEDFDEEEIIEYEDDLDSDDFDEEDPDGEDEIIEYEDDLDSDGEDEEDPDDEDEIIEYEDDPEDVIDGEEDPDDDDEIISYEEDLEEDTGEEDFEDDEDEIIEYEDDPEEDIVDDDYGDEDDEIIEYDDDLENSGDGELDEDDEDDEIIEYEDDPEDNEPWSPDKSKFSGSNGVVSGKPNLYGDHSLSSISGKSNPASAPIVSSDEKLADALVKISNRITSLPAISLKHGKKVVKSMQVDN